MQTPTPYTIIAVGTVVSTQNIDGKVVVYGSFKLCRSQVSTVLLDFGIDLSFHFSTRTKQRMIAPWFK